MDISDIQQNKETKMVDITFCDRDLKDVLIISISKYQFDELIYFYRENLSLKAQREGKCKI